jgi:ubiquinone/menaquinone biosynthesis C-methylase UbiE
MLGRASQAGSFRLVLGDAGRLPFADGAFPFTSVALALHEKPPQARPDILAEMLRVTAHGGLVVVVDYLSPQTTGQTLLAVGIKAIERMAGREHHAYYSDFMESGGLEGFLGSHGLIPYEIRRSFLKLIGMALIRRPV